jgi:hypothetical protein
MQLGSLGAGIGSFFQTPAGGGPSIIDNIGGWLGKTFGSGTTPAIDPSSGNYGDLPQTGSDSYLI